MAPKKFSDHLKGEVGHSFSVIKKHFKNQNIAISNGFLSKLKNGTENSTEINNVQQNRGRRSALSKVQLNRLNILTNSTDPPTQRAQLRRCP